MHKVFYFHYLTKDNLLSNKIDSPTPHSHKKKGLIVSASSLKYDIYNTESYIVLLSGDWVRREFRYITKNSILLSNGFSLVMQLHIHFHLPYPFLTSRNNLGI